MEDDPLECKKKILELSLIYIFIHRKVRNYVCCYSFFLYSHGMTCHMSCIKCPEEIGGVCHMGGLTVVSSSAFSVAILCSLHLPA